MISQGKGNSLLVGTTKNIILQGSFDLKFSPVMQGHVDELWGLAVCPSQNQFVTIGYDKLLYLWDTLTRGSIWCKELPDGGQCVCVHPEGQIIIVSSVSSSRWYVIDVTSRDIIESHSDAAERIDCIEFSPSTTDAKFLACGSRDNSIYIYSVSEGGRKYNKIAKLSGHSSFVTHLDWSADGQYIQSNSGDYELLYWSAATWRQVTSSAQLRDVEWATQNCTLSFSSYGIWPEGADGTDINGCCRSVRHHLIASADDFGKVNLFNYPCNVPRAVGHSYRGHSSHVTTVRFLCDDSRLLSLGGKDSAILQWQVIDGVY
jgi:microtubule-associated protein-like 1/2